MKKVIEKQFEFVMPLTDYVKDSATNRFHPMHTGDLTITYMGFCNPNYLNPEDMDMAYGATILKVADMYGNDITGIVCFSSLFESAHQQIIEAAIQNCEYQFTEDRLGKLEAEEQSRFEEAYANSVQY